MAVISVPSPFTVRADAADGSNLTGRVEGDAIMWYAKLTEQDGAGARAHHNVR
jgi:hypothetical protein